MQEHQRFELFSFWRTSATYRVRVALNLKGVSAREHDIDLEAGEQRQPDFLRINPMAAIPALIDHAGHAGHADAADSADGAPPAALTQSLAILEFLDELYPSPPLLPTGAHARARVRSLAQLLCADTHPLITPRVKKYLTTTGGFDDAAWRAWQIHWFTTGLLALETRLAEEAGTGDFCHGDKPGMADICLASIVVVTRVFKIEVDGIPTVRRIMANCEKLDSFTRADPRRQAGAPA